MPLTATLRPIIIISFSSEAMRDRQCALNHDATESLSVSQMCHKQTDDGRLVDITCIPTTCCGEIF